MFSRLLLATALLVLSIALTAATPPPAAQTAPVTWANIAPVVNASCAECHHPGGPAPFSLLDYPDVRRHARQIAYVTSSRFMPPWLPDQSSAPLLHARRLSDTQVALFARWAAAGAPEGDPATAPAAPQFSSGWTRGTPDLVVRAPKAYKLPGETTSPYRCLVLPLRLPDDRWLRALEFRPGNPAVVRHAVIYADPSGTARTLEAQSGAVGYAARDAGLGPGADRLAEWAVGSGPYTLPNGAAEQLPAGSDLVLLLRFEPDGQSEPVQPEVGLYYASQPPAASPTNVTLGARDLILRPAQRATITDSFILPVAARLLRLTPHGHPICRQLDVTAVPPGGPAQTLLQINDWNADWQDSYQFAQPSALPAGTRLTVRWQGDNSADNPRNPASPPMAVMPGLLYLDDMATVQCQLLADKAADATTLTQAVRAFRPAPVIEETVPNRHG